MKVERALLCGLLLLVPAFAGCASSDEPPAPGGTSSPAGGSSSGSKAPFTTPSPTVSPPPRGTSERWHFHDHWKGTPTITLLDANVTLNATTRTPDGVPGLGIVLELPNGVIVPPETGFLTFNISWETDTPGVVNLTYKPADSNDFFIGGDLEKGVGFDLPTTESNADVPHRQASAWKFNFTARPGGTPPSVPPRDVHIVIQATIGRPLFIDPPHFNWWGSGDILTVVEGSEGAIRAAQTPAGNMTLPTGLPGTPSVPPALPDQDAVAQSPRVPVDEGRIVPEGAKSIVAVLNWTSSVPNAKLALRYAESNFPSEAAMELLSESPGSRVYTWKVAQAQTDTTYSNRTTWEFHILPEGENAAAFEGTYTLVAWTSRLDAATTAARVGL